MNSIMCLFLIFLLLGLGLSLLLSGSAQSKPAATPSHRQAEEDEPPDPLLQKTSLGKRELLLIRLRATLKACAITEQRFFLLSGAACLLGLIAGSLLFSSWLVGFFCSLTCSILPYLYFTVKRQKSERLQEDQLGNIMATITNAYASSNDLISAVRSYVSERNQRQGQPLFDPFGEYLAEVTMIDADQTRALLILQAKVSNSYFHDWVKMLILCVSDGKMKFALYPILEGMNDKKTLQEENDSAMKKIWINFVTIVGLSFSIPLMLKLLNADWYEIMVTTLVGKAILIVMFIYSIIAAFLVLRINQPIYR